jgi:hypothetical protein
MIRLVKGLPSVTCDVCAKPITDASLAVAMQPKGSQHCWHVCKCACERRATKMLEFSPRPIVAVVELVDHLHDLAALIPGVPQGCEPGDDDEIELPAPAVLSESLMARAWAEGISDTDRLLLEQGARVITRLMGRCVLLAQAAERREAQA